MRLSLVCFFLSLLAPTVRASAMAGPFETMFFWYVYRMDCLAFGKPNRIATGCHGGGPGGTCLFDEFLRHIQSHGTPERPIEPWTGSTSVGTNLDPDVWNTANELLNSGERDTPTRYPNVYDPLKIMPELEQAPNHENFLGKMVDVVQDSRAKAGLTQLEPQLDNVRLALGFTYEARIGDMTKYLIIGLNKLLKKNGVTWEVETFRQPLEHGYSVDMVDTEATMKAHDDMGKDLKRAVYDFMDNFAAKGKGKSHYKTILAIQTYQETLWKRPCSG